MEERDIKLKITPKFSYLLDQNFGYVLIVLSIKMPDIINVSNLNRAKQITILIFWFSMDIDNIPGNRRCD